MRNLKKILALALALIMSLSLMVTASAARTEFGDQDSINENYQVAIEVLNNLGVLKGDDRDGDGVNDFRPLDTITRGEVAAIIYRVFTGKTDVATDNHGIYTAAEGEFADVKGHWSEGYMVYCYQGEYIKGWPGAGGVVLNPGGEITGYEVLTMILRAVGYDKKENEFTGLNWKLNVSTTATTRGVLKNYHGTDLGAPATRQEVAELIFRAILLPKVQYDLRSNSYSFPDADDTIAANPLGMKRVEGVVTENEYASLLYDEPLDAGQTRLGGKVYNVSSWIDDLGESRAAYVQGSTVLSSLEDTGDNVIASSDARITNSGSSTVAALAKSAGIDANSLDDAEHFYNFGPITNTDPLYTNIKIKYVVKFAVENYLNGTRFVDPNTPTSDEWQAIVDEINGLIDDFRDDLGLTSTTRGVRANVTVDDIFNSSTSKRTAAFVYDADTDTATYEYAVEIAPETTVIPDDLAVIKHIFYTADREKGDDDDGGAYVEGEVYVGTSSVDDISDDRTVTYNTFRKDFILGGDDYDTPVLTNENGNYVKIIDNDGDGNAEYVLKNQYILDKIEEIDKDGNIYFKTLVWDDSSNGDTIYPLYDDPAEGDVVIISEWTDGVYYVEKAEIVTGIVDNYSYRDDTINIVDVGVYGQSGIAFGADLDLDIPWVGEKTPVDWDNDAVILELYHDIGEQAWDELEYNFYLDKYGYVRAFEETDKSSVYALLTEAYAEAGRRNDVIRELTGFAEVTIQSTTTREYTVNNYGVSTANYFFTLDRTVNGLDDDQDPENITAANVENVDLYRAVNWEDDNGNTKTSFTNVAVYGSLDEDDRTVSLYDPTDTIGTIRARSIVRLDTDDGISARQRSYDIASDADGEEITTANYNKVYVSANQDTEYYVVLVDEASGNVRRVVSYNVGWSTVKALDEDDIYVAYALVSETRNNSETDLFGVAEVIVIEVTKAPVSVDDTIFGYYVPQRTTSKVQEVSAILGDGTTDTVYEANTWMNSVAVENGINFYDVAGSYDGSVKLTLVTDYVSHYIFADIIDRVEDIDYVKMGTQSGDKHLDLEDAYVYRMPNARSVEDGVRLTNRNVGDGLIWVEDGRGNVIYAILVNEDSPAGLIALYGLVAAAYAVAPGGIYDPDGELIIRLPFSATSSDKALPTQNPFARTLAAGTTTSTATENVKSKDDTRWSADPTAAFTVVPPAGYTVTVTNPTGSGNVKELSAGKVDLTATYTNGQTLTLSNPAGSYSVLYSAVSGNIGVTLTDIETDVDTINTLSFDDADEVGNALTKSTAAVGSVDFESSADDVEELIGMYEIEDGATAVWTFYSKASGTKVGTITVTNDGGDISYKGDVSLLTTDADKYSYVEVVVTSPDKGDSDTYTIIIDTSSAEVPEISGSDVEVGASETLHVGTIDGTKDEPAVVNVTGGGEVVVETIGANAVVTVDADSKLTVTNIEAGADITVSDLTKVTFGGGTQEESIHYEGDTIQSVSNIQEGVLFDVQGDNISAGLAVSSPERREFCVVITGTSATGNVVATITSDDGKTVVHHEDTLSAIKVTYMFCPEELNDGDASHNNYKYGATTDACYDAGGCGLDVMQKTDTNNKLKSGHYTIVIKYATGAPLFESGFTVE